LVDEEEDASLCFLINGARIALVSAANLISRKFAFPDFDTGILMGFGIGLELVGAFLIIRHKKLSAK